MSIWMESSEQIVGLGCNFFATVIRTEDLLCRPFIDLDKSVTADQLNFYSDATAKESLGFWGGLQ